MAGTLREELHRLVDGQLQHVGDGLVLEAHLQRLAVVALPLADLAGDEDVGQELHLDLLQPVPLAGLAAPALDVEGEAPRLVAPDAGLRDLGEESPGWRRRPRCRWPGWSAGCARWATWSMAITLSRCCSPSTRSCAPGAHVGAVQVAAPGPVEDVVDQGGLAGAGDAGDAGEGAQGEGHGDVLEVVLLRPAHRQRGARAGRCPGAARGAPRSLRRPERNCPVRDSREAGDVRQGAAGHDLPPVHPRPGAEVHDLVRGAWIVSSSCSTTSRVLPRSRRRSRVSDQLAVVPLVQPDGGLVQDVQHPHQATADLAGQADALRLPPGEGARRRGPG